MTLDCASNLDRGLSQLRLLIREKALLGAGGAFRAVQAFKTTAQARMPQGAVATAIARQLVQNPRDLGGVLVDMDLPWITEILSGKLCRH